MAVSVPLGRPTNAVVPPVIDAIPKEPLSPYEPFDIIDGFAVPAGTLPSGDPEAARRPRRCSRLHHKQFEALIAWLRRRELGPARWVVRRQPPDQHCCEGPVALGAPEPVSLPVQLWICPYSSGGDSAAVRRW